MTKDRDAELLVRVRKLLDKADGTTNPHEADAFARKAAELIAEHRIDPDRIATIDPSDDLRVRETYLGRGAYVRARLALLLAIAEAHDVRVVFQSRPEGTVAMAAGYRSDLDVVDVLYSSLHQQAATQMAAIRRQTGAATQKFRRSFLFGYADRLGEMLAESKVVAESAAGASADQAASLALALQTRDERIDEFAGVAFGRVRAARSPSAANVAGWDAGASAAGAADVGRTRLAGRKGLAARSSGS